MKKFPILLLLTACWSLAAAQERPQVPAAQKRNLRTEIIAADSTGELLAQLRNMPNIEIGKGITFRPKNDWFELTMRFRMQNLLALSFDDDFTLTKTEAVSNGCGCASTVTSIRPNWSTRSSWDSPPTTQSRCPAAT